MKTRYILFPLALILLALIVGCSNKKESASSTTSLTEASTSTTSTTGVRDMNYSTVVVELTDMAIALDTATAPAGNIHFMVKNDGRVIHSFAIRGTGINARLRSNLAPGAADILMVTLRPGKYEVYCPMRGHEAQGMRSDFTVQ